MIIQIILFLIQIYLGWLLLGALCWVVTMIYAFFACKHKITIIDIGMLPVLTLKGGVSLFKLLEIVAREEPRIPQYNTALEPLEKDCCTCNNLYDNKCTLDPQICGEARKLWELRRRNTNEN